MGKEGRVVVTGMDMITPLGLDQRTSWERLKAGESGVTQVKLPLIQLNLAGKMKDYDPEALLRDVVEKHMPHVYLAGLVKASSEKLRSELKGIIEKKDLKKISRSALLALLASIRALKKANLYNEELDPDKRYKDGETRVLREDIDPFRVGVLIGTGVGGANNIVNVRRKMEAGERVTSFDLLSMLPERTSTVVSMKIGTKGPLASIAKACASGSEAIYFGCKLIADGSADIMIVGGAESIASDPAVLEGFNSLGVLASELDRKKASYAASPFDRARRGFVIGEGAAVIILESEEHARERGVEILARITGYSSGSDGGVGGDAGPNVEGEAKTIENAVKMSGGIPSEGIVIVQFHATGTGGEAYEALATKKALDKYDCEIYGSSNKGAFGHTIGAAGSISAVVGVESQKEGVIPPTNNLKDPLDETEGIHLSALAQTVKGDKVIVNAFGFGGGNNVLVFERPGD